MKIFNLILLLFTITTFSCDVENCPECMTPPRFFHFDIIDKTTKENIFSNRTYKAEDIAITNTLSDNNVDFELITANNYNQLVIYSIGWQTEVVHLKVKIADDYIFSFHVDAERKSEDCCSFTEYNEISVEDVEYETEPNTQVYKILVDLQNSAPFQ